MEIYFPQTEFTARSLTITVHTVMHMKCQCLLVAPVFTAEPQIVFSLLAASKDTERALGKP